MTTPKHMTDREMLDLCGKEFAHIVTGLGVREMRERALRMMREIESHFTPTEYDKWMDERTCTTDVGGRKHTWPEPAYMPTPPVEVDVSVKNVPWPGAVSVHPCMNYETSPYMNFKFRTMPDGSTLASYVLKDPTDAKDAKDAKEKAFADGLNYGFWEQGEPPKQHFWRCEHYPSAIHNWWIGARGCMKCDHYELRKVIDEQFENELREIPNECKPATSSR